MEWDEIEEDWNHDIWTPMKQKWYIKAGKHWVENMQLQRGKIKTCHQIKIYVVKYEEGKKLTADLIFDVTKAWTTGFKRQPQQAKNKAAILRELAYLEKNAI
jgi:hypothetical protein